MDRGEHLRKGRKQKWQRIRGTETEGIRLMFSYRAVGTRPGEKDGDSRASQVFMGTVRLLWKENLGELLGPKSEFSNMLKIIY